MSWRSFYVSSCFREYANLLASCLSHKQCLKKAAQNHKTIIDKTNRCFLAPPPIFELNCFFILFAAPLR